MLNKQREGNLSFIIGNKFINFRNIKNQGYYFIMKVIFNKGNYFGNISSSRFSWFNWFKK